jgi:hypothetical protein
VNPAEAKRTLLLYRPGNGDDTDLDLAKALECVERDAELRTWFEQQKLLQSAVQRKFRELPVPADLKETILKQQKIVSPPAGWQTPAWLKIAAVLVVFGGLAAFALIFWNRASVPDGFGDYQSRMVRSALREYRMDLLTNDLPSVRRWMVAQGAPSDFSVPKGLAQLEVVGGGALRWRNNPVAMICFHREDKQMLFLFVMNSSAVKDPPPWMPSFTKVSRLATASWSEGDKTYFLAGPEEEDFLQKYLWFNRKG